jgi:ABC-2 type transport system permease protein
MKFVAITRKEFVDKISDNVLLFSYMILMVIVLISSVSAALTFNRNVSELSAFNGNLEKAIENNMHSLFDPLSQTISQYGIVLALILSSSNIIREKASGTLRVVLSYPVFRDSIIIGKQVAWLAIVSTAVLSCFLLSVAVELPLTGVTFSGMWLTVIVLFYLVSILYILLFIELGFLFSQRFNNASTSLLAGLIIVLLFNSSFWRYFGNILGQAFLGSPNQIVQIGGGMKIIATTSPLYEAFLDLFNKFNPTYSYSQILQYLCSIFLYKSHDAFGVLGGVSYYLDMVTILVFYLVALFLANYIVFRRTELQ